MTNTLKKSIEVRHAVIYCRVSSKKQREEGSGLKSQEHRCREYAENLGYQIDAVFPDDVTGGGDFIKRAGMVALLAYLDTQHDKNYIVIFDDLKRFARDTEFHIKLRREFKMRRATIECLNFRFDDTPEGKFIETVFAAHGELEREQNGRQTVQKMKARVEQGFHVFKAPVGYEFKKSPRGGKEFVPREPLASIVKEALEGYACGRYQTQVEVKRYLESQPAYPKDLPNGEVRQQRIFLMLQKPIYAGYVEAPKWKISRRKGQHEGLISYKTFEKIQNRLNANALAPARKDINMDFPLRGFVTCGDCHRTLRSCWSKGKYKKYPYYLCHNTKCESYGKSIGRAKVEGAFEDILKRLSPSESLFQMVTVMIENAWQQRLSQTEGMKKLMQKEVFEIDKKIDGLLDRIVDSNNQMTISAYEKKINQLENQKLLKVENLQNKGKLRASYDQIIELSLKFLSNPYKIWETGNIHLQKMVLRLAFTGHMPYHREMGHRTPHLSLPFKVLASISGGEKEMVPQERIELSTSPLPRVRSTTEPLRQLVANEVL